MELSGFSTGISVEIDASGARSGAGEVNRALDSMGAHTKRTLNEVKHEFSALKDNIFDVRSVMGTLFAGAAVYGGSALAQQFAAADRGFRDIKSLGVPQTLREIREEVSLTSRAFGVDLADATKSYYDAISAGVRPDAVRPLVDSAAMLKDVAQGDMPGAIDILTSAVNAYGKSVEDVGGIADDFALTVNKGKITLSQMKLFGGIMSSAATNKVPLEELLAITSIATAKGVTPEQTLTGLGAAMDDISNPTDEARMAAKALNLEWGLAGIQSRGLIGLLNDISAAYDRMAPGLDSVIKKETERQATLKNRTSDDEKYLRFLQEVRATGEAGAIMALLPSREARRPITAVAGENIEELNRSLADFYRNSGNMEETWNALFKNAPSTELARFRSEMDELKIATGEVLTKAALPLLQEFIVPGARAVREFTRENEALVKVVTGLGSGLATVYAGGALVRSVQVLESFVGLTRLAGSALGALTQPVAATVRPTAALSAKGLQSELALLTNGAAITKSEIEQMKAINFTADALTGKHKAQIAAIASTQAAITALEAQTAATLTTSTATKGLWATLAAHPVGLAVTAVAALGVGVYAYRREINELLHPLEKEKRLLQESNDLSQQRISRITRLGERYESLATKANRTLTEEIALKDVSKELNGIFPDLALGVNNSADAITNLANAIDQAKLGESIKSLTGEMALGIRELEALQRQSNAAALSVHSGVGSRLSGPGTSLLTPPASNQYQGFLQQAMAAGEQMTDLLFARRYGVTRERHKEFMEQIGPVIDPLHPKGMLKSLLTGGKEADTGQQIATWLMGRKIKQDEIWGAINVDPGRFAPGAGGDDPMRSFNDRMASLERETAAVRARSKVYGDGITSNDAFAASLDKVNAFWKATEDVASLDIDNAAMRNQMIQQLAGQYIALAASERDLAKEEESRAKTQRDLEAEDLRQKNVAERAKSLSLERDEIVRLYEAQQQGVTAHKDMNDLLERERILREAGITKKDKEYGLALDMIDAIQKTRRATEELTDAQSLAKDLEERFMSPADWRSKQLDDIGSARQVGLNPAVDARAVQDVERQFRDMQRQILADSWDMRDGMELAFWDIRDISDNAAAQVYDAWTGTYRGMTDELNRMLLSGEMSLKGFLTVLQGAAAQFASEQIMGSVFNLFGKAFGMGGGIEDPSAVFRVAPGIGAAPRALGGPVSERSLYLIGERGPELFSPGQSGTVYPNSMLSLLEKNLALPKLASQPMPAAAMAQPPAARQAYFNGTINLNFKLDGNKPIPKQVAFETERAVGAKLAELLEKGGRDR